MSINNANRIILNTGVLYAKALITMGISFITVPVVLRALGKSDYGLYNLIAGVIAMLSFLNASLTVSTQRFMSVAMGKNDQSHLNVIYNVGLRLHLYLGLGIVIFLEILEPFIFGGFLNIELDKIGTAKILYQILVGSTFFTIASVPFNALLNAYENLIVFALLSIFDAVLRLILALSLIFCPFDKLIYYGSGIAFVTILTAILKYVYIVIKYKNFAIGLLKYYDKTVFKEMSGFAGWNTFGGVAIIGRNQGMAIILNLFYGTIANAAYGIANQLNSLLSYFTSTLQQAINPQLMRSEGMGDRNRLLRISFTSSKFSVLIICLLAIPLIVEMPYVAELWLKDVPENTVIFARLVIILSIIFQYSSGLMSAIQSVGNIRSYFISVSAVLLISLPLAYILLKMDKPAYYAVLSIVIAESLAFPVRILYAKNLVGMSIRDFIRFVVWKTAVPIVSGGVLAIVLHIIMQESFLRLIIVCVAYATLYLIEVWLYSLDVQERNVILQLLSKIAKK